MRHIPELVHGDRILVASPKKRVIVVVEAKARLHLGVRLTGSKVTRRTGQVILFAHRPHCYEKVGTIKDLRGVVYLESNDYCFECNMFGGSPVKSRLQIKLGLKKMGFDTNTIDEVFAVGRKGSLRIKRIIHVKEKMPFWTTGFDKYSVALLDSTDLFLGSRFGDGNKCLAIFTNSRGRYSVVDILYYDASRHCKPFEWQRMRVDDYGKRCSRAYAERRLRRLGFGSKMPDKVFPRHDSDGGKLHETG